MPEIRRKSYTTPSLYAVNSRGIWFHWCCLIFLRISKINWRVNGQKEKKLTRGSRGENVLKINSILCCLLYVFGVHRIWNHTVALIESHSNRMLTWTRNLNDKYNYIWWITQRDWIKSNRIRSKWLPACTTAEWKLNPRRSYTHTQAGIHTMLIIHTRTHTILTHDVMEEKQKKTRFKKDRFKNLNAADSAEWCVNARMGECVCVFCFVGGR